MDSNRRIISPARRSRRCALVLIAFSVLVGGAYVAVHSDRLFLGGRGIAATDSGKDTEAATKDRQPSSAQLQVTLAGPLAPQTAARGR